MSRAIFVQIDVCTGKFIHRSPVLTPAKMFKVFDLTQTRLCFFKCPVGSPPGSFRFSTELDIRPQPQRSSPPSLSKQDRYPAAVMVRM
jgi:hypothetical protein